MLASPPLRCGALACLAWLAPLSGPLAAEAPSAPARPLPELRIERPNDMEAGALLRGPDASWQMIVTAHDEAGSARDVTRQSTYDAEPEGIVEVSSGGRITPRRDGRTRVVARYGELDAALDVEVERYAEPLGIHFANQVVPVFTRLGCNAGGCHGKSGGQNGFRLSLLGFEPDDDYEFLTREVRGRRLFPAAPPRSLLLEKATNVAPHGGGQKLLPESPEYRLLARWIAQGMPRGAADEPIVEALRVLPEARRMTAGGEQPLLVLARYSDGRYEDVTRLAQLEATDPSMVEALPGGLVRSGSRPGEAAVMARFQGQVAVFRATIPLGESVEELPDAGTVIDQHVFAKLQALGLPPSPACDDATFVRRATLDIAGRIPTAEEARAFLSDSEPSKRERLVDRLLDSTDYADWFAAKWSAVLRNKRRTPEHRRGTLAFHRWISQSLYDNLPYDQFVRQIIAATGDVATHPPVAWYREVKDATQQVEDVSQLFLGVRLQCARCHHHPFERWSQTDYFRMAAFFSRVDRKLGRPREDVYYHSPGVADARHPRGGQALKPAGLGGPVLELDADDDPRQRLVDWMAEPGNPFFSKALVNRYWKHFLGRGIVEPEDDFRATNPATNDPLLEALAAEFVASGFDLKQLIRRICTSQAYQLSSEPNPHNGADQQAYARHYPQRLAAEPLLDAIDQVTGAVSDFAGVPRGTRASALPDPAVESYFLTVFGKPQADTACECERTQEASLAQSLHLLNSPEVQAKLASDTGRAARLAADASQTTEQKLTELYLLALSRPPTPQESAAVAAYLAERADAPRQAWEDVVWALINTKEFLFNH